MRTMALPCLTSQVARHMQGQHPRCELSALLESIRQSLNMFLPYCRVFGWTRANEILNGRYDSHAQRPLRIVLIMGML